MNKRLLLLPIIVFFSLGNIPYTAAFANEVSDDTSSKQQFESKQLFESQDVLNKDSSTESSNSSVASSSEDQEEISSQEVKNETKETVTSTEENTNKKTELNVNQSALSDWTVKDNADNTITLIAYHGSSTDIIVPNQIDGKQTKIDLSAGLPIVGMDPKRVTSITFSNEGNRKAKLINKKISFSNYFNLKSFDGEGLDASGVTDLSELFMKCSYLKTIKISGWDTSQVTDMSFMFSDCSSLTSLDVSNWDTSQVTNMSRMFSSCSSLTSLDVSKWNTSQVTDMSFMFYSDTSLINLDVSNWDTSQVTNMSNLFRSMPSLTKLDVSKWITSQVTTMSFMFSGCSSLTSLDVSKWNTSQVTDMSFMFYSDTSLINLDVSNWDTSQVTNMSNLFRSMPSLTKLDVSKWITSQVTTMSFMFSGCSSLTSLDVSKWNTSQVTTMEGVFGGCSSLTSLNVSKWNTSQVTTMRSMFNSCSSLTSLDVSNWDTSQVTDMDTMFYYTLKITYLNLSSFKLDKVPTAYMASMFSADKQTPLFVVATDSKLLNYNYKQDSRFITGPVFDANIGQFEDGTNIKYYFDSCAVKPNDPKLTLKTFFQFKNSLKPNYPNLLLKEWRGKELTTDAELLDINTYNAVWTNSFINGNIPSEDDNTKPTSVTRYGIAYMPKQFVTNKSPLEDHGAQTIPVNKSNNFHVAVRDQSLMEKNSWSLQAQLVWKDKTIPGSSIQTTNSTGEVKKNINTGSNSFEESNLVSIPNNSDAPVEGEKNVEITSTAKVIMKAKFQEHNAVYDYNLGDVSLKIENTKIVEPGLYNGYIEWNLVDAP